MKLQQVISQLKQYLEGQYANVVNVIKTRDISEYRYRQVIVPTYGKQDGNYQSRFHFLIYLLYFIDCFSREEIEDIIRDLFKEELIDRRTNSFQGIGLSLEILTYLLSYYNKEEYIQLFKEAKEANFDCHCGYKYENINQAPMDLDFSIYTIDDCLYLSNELQLNTLTKEIAEIKKQDKNINIYDLSKLRYYYRDLQDDKNELLILEKIMIETEKQGNLWKICNTQIDYLKKLICLDQMEAAKKIIEQIRTYIHESRADWYEYNQGLYYIESCLDFILKDTDEGYKKELWDWSCCYLKQREGFYGNLVSKIISVAAMYGEDEYARKIEEDWNERINF